MLMLSLSELDWKSSQFRDDKKASHLSSFPSSYGDQKKMSRPSPSKFNLL